MPKCIILVEWSGNAGGLPYYRISRKRWWGSEVMYHCTSEKDVEGITQELARHYNVEVRWK